MSGTDEEFNARAEKITSELPEFTSKMLKERTAKLLVPTSFRERPGVLSLAMVWFKCGSCDPRLIRGEDALKHECSRPWCAFENPIGAVTFDTFILRRGWRADKFTFLGNASAVARRVILEHGGDSERITLDEINSKLYRFIVHETDGRFVCSWMQRVSLLVL